MIDLQQPFESSYDQVTQALKKVLEEQLQRKKIPDHPKANDLFFDALEADTNDETFDLLCEVIDLDPAHIDAQLARLDFLDLEPEQEITLLEPLIQLAAKRLGSQTFKKCQGNFWLIGETRPYMRVKQHLAICYQELGQVDKAIAEWEEMLKLNPIDNQGARYELLPISLQLGRIDESQQLLDAFDEVDSSVIFSWCQVLCFFVLDDLKVAMSAAERAQTQNPHMRSYLIGTKRIPKNPPGSYDPGSLEEAKCFAAPLVAAWKAHPKSRKWLRELS
ncbi:tetratricopeptide repeat protein [bacterium]|jgi:tetratricopeptide (TPR) repeat protein|nr:tetratricopeptide repeat protein [bacterium]